MLVTQFLKYECRSHIHLNLTILSFSLLLWVEKSIMLIIFRILLFFREHECWKSDFVIEKVWGRGEKKCVCGKPEEIHKKIFSFEINNVISLVSTSLYVCLSTSPKWSGNFHECESFCSYIMRYDFFWVYVGLCHSVSLWLYHLWFKRNNFINFSVDESLKWDLHNIFKWKFYNTFWDYQN